VNGYVLGLIVHIGGGGVALGAGAAALAFRKGGRAHAKAGTWFFAAMLVLLATGFVLAVAGSFRGTAGGAIFGIYLVATARETARRRDGKAGRFEHAALAVAIGCALAELAFGFQAMSSPGGRLDGFPPMPYFLLAGWAALAAGLDLNFILRRGVSARQRIARHLWRMCAALLFAAFSFFLGQQKVMPAAWHGALWLYVPPLAVLAAMIFWLIRVRLSGAFRARAASPACA
jgi:hypothetical protein